MQGSQEIVHAILDAHHAHISDNGLSHLSQAAIWFDRAIKTAEFDPVANDGDKRFRNAAAIHGDPLVRFIRDNDVIGKTAAQRLQPEKYAINHRVSTA